MTPEAEAVRCCICRLPILDRLMIGAGDGPGNRFAHPLCWHQQEAQGLRSLLGVREEERAAALRIAYQLTPDCQSLPDAMLALVDQIGNARWERDAAREQMRLNAEALDATRADHHAPGQWTTCAWCVRFFRQDEEGAAENARLREHRTRLQEHNTELVERARVAELALAESCENAALQKSRYQDADKALAEMTEECTCLRQVSGDVCEVCGWAGIRDDGCAFCAVPRMEARLKVGDDLADALRWALLALSHLARERVSPLSRDCTGVPSQLAQEYAEARGDLAHWDAGKMEEPTAHDYCPECGSTHAGPACEPGAEHGGGRS